MSSELSPPPAYPTLLVTKPNVYAFLSAATVIVPDGCRLQMSSGDVLGSHFVQVEESGDGPLIEIRAIPVLGNIEVRSG